MGLRARFFLGLLAGACTVTRDPPERTGGVHPPGWSDITSSAFHAAWLRSQGEPLGDCQTCHGADYGGGAVRVGCSTTTCHTQDPGPEWCGTCHGSREGPEPEKPTTGAHSAHAVPCRTCHVVPERVLSEGHVDGDGIPEVTFSGWDRSTGRCSGIYCHQAGTPRWNPPDPKLACGDCHLAPPANHARFGRLTMSSDGEARCDACHPVPPGDKHVDGNKDLTLPDRCDTCHGSGRGGPPPALDGAVLPTDRAVGAHRRHGVPELWDRIGRSVNCDACHEMPEEVFAEGHMDDAAPADVRLRHGGVYQPDSGTCVTRCHWNRDPGPSWTDDSGAARACDACHGNPPERTRAGTPHVPAAPEVAVCQSCHLFEVAEHVDGDVDFRQ